MTLTELRNLLQNRKILSDEELKVICDRMAQGNEKYCLEEIQRNARLKEFMDRTYTL